MAKSKAKSKYSENLIRMRCSVCKSTNYYTRINKKKTAGLGKKLELKKLCEKCKKRTPHTQAKV
jgi:ribosomal protein L33